MNPEQERELADAIVACGVGEKREFPGRYHVNGATLWQERFIRDWRVAGALITKLRKAGFSFLLHSMPDGKALMTITSPLPDRQEWAAQIADDEDIVAINQACVAALRGKDDEG